MTKTRFAGSHRRRACALFAGLGALAAAAGAARAETDEERWFRDFLAQTGEHTLHDEHEAWHSSVRSSEADYGTKFLSFHHQFIRKYELWRARQGLPPIPMWDPGTALPADIPHAGRNASYTPVPTPTWARRTGGTATSPRFGRTKLAQFRSADELGRDIDWSWHGSVHMAVGGDMARVHSAPSDPLFWRWHKYLDGIWQDWQKGPAKADFNLDFTPDVLWHDPATGETSVWFTTTSFPFRGPSVSFLAFDQRAVDHPGEGWAPAGTGDFDGDKKADILWRQGSSGRVELWLMDGTRATSKSLVFPGLAAGFQVQATPDVDGDGRSDIALRNLSLGRTTIYLMAGGTVRSGTPLPADGVDVSIAGSGDFDRDGHADLVLRDGRTGATSIAYMTLSSGVPAVRATTPLGAGQPELAIAWEIAALGDFDGDLVPDLLWRNRAGNEGAVWLVGNAVVKQRASLGFVPPTDGGPAITDLDADGRADVVWHSEQRASGPSAGLGRAWYMNGAAIARQETLAPMPIDTRIVQTR